MRETMNEKVEINDPTDWTIIRSFYRAEKRILMLKKIVSIVRESSDKKDKAIEARIRNLVKKNYIIKYEYKSSQDTAPDDKKSKGMPRPGLYGLNESLEFEYTGVILSSRLNPAEIPDEIRRNHTKDLKVAISSWIQYFPEPTYNSLAKRDQLELSIDGDENLDPLGLDLSATGIMPLVSLCEQHLLFSDLGNHLPNVGCDVFIKWENYKMELTELHEMHRALLISITAEVEEWLRMSFRIYELPRSIRMSSEIASTICTLLLRFVSLDKLITDTFSSDPIPCMRGGMTSAQLKEMLDIVDSPNRDNLNERKELAPFSRIVERILQNKKIMKSVNDFAVKIRDLEMERSTMIRDLEKALLYTSYPGECQYLR
jgi:hypothetical protein